MNQSLFKIILVIMFKGGMKLTFVDVSSKEVSFSFLYYEASTLFSQ